MQQCNSNTFRPTVTQRADSRDRKVRPSRGLRSRDDHSAL